MALQVGEYYIYTEEKPITLQEATPEQVFSWATSTYPWIRKVLNISEQDILTTANKQKFVAILTNTLSSLKLVTREKVS